ncbi:hypothetical protein EVAR_2912_1 [Eumeta japonica]|uniref:Uncharacterized protein n=1 Tax=Eumeta variegata TaxID=151549 RepID=A0A4C1T1V1_EUMVA|nr:hypothetical protein EVAR_2912_1 [Eumeta japonica]
MLWSTGLHHENGSARLVSYRTITIYRRERTASAVAFRLVSESSSGLLPSPSLHFHLLSLFLSLKDILFQSKNPATHCAGSIVPRFDAITHACLADGQVHRTGYFGLCADHI